MTFTEFDDYRTRPMYPKMVDAFGNPLPFVDYTQTTFLQPWEVHGWAYPEEMCRMPYMPFGENDIRHWVMENDPKHISAVKRSWQAFKKMLGSVVPWTIAAYSVVNTIKSLIDFTSTYTFDDLLFSPDAHAVLKARMLMYIGQLGARKLIQIAHDYQWKPEDYLPPDGMRFRTVVHEGYVYFYHMNPNIPEGAQVVDYPGTGEEEDE
jgi:hypothetical protein